MCLHKCSQSRVIPGADNLLQVRAGHSLHCGVQCALIWVHDESTVSNDATRLICQRTLANNELLPRAGGLVTSSLSSLVCNLLPGNIFYVSLRPALNHLNRFVCYPSHCWQRFLYTQVSFAVVLRWLWPCTPLYKRVHSSSSGPYTSK